MTLYEFGLIYQDVASNFTEFCGEAVRQGRDLHAICESTSLAEAVVLNAFDWSETSQGQEYWAKICMDIMEKCSVAI